MTFQVVHPALPVVGFGILSRVIASALAGLTHSVPLNMSLITKYGHDKEYGICPERSMSKPLIS